MLFCIFSYFFDISKYTPLPLVVFLHVSLRTSSCRVFINRFWHFAAACHADLFSDFGTGHPQPDYFHIKIRLVAKSIDKPDPFTLGPNVEVYRHRRPCLARGGYGKQESYDLQWHCRGFGLALTWHCDAT